MAFTTQEGQESKKYIPLERATARKWLTRCIPYASDEKKIELREKLYPLQYSTPSFRALKSKIGSMLKEIPYHERKSFNNIPEFEWWKDSFEHKTYCAARPSNALSCVEFNTLKSENQIALAPNQQPDVYGVYRPTYEGNVYKRAVFFICRCCGEKKELSYFKPNEGDILACNTCIKKNLSGKVIDLSDCYNFDLVSLHRIIGRAYYHRSIYNTCDKGTVEAQEYIEHLPQIHLPMLGLLVHYNGINYYEGYGGSYPSCATLTFGTGLVDLNPIDISGFELFKNTSKDKLICIFNIRTKNDVISLKPALAKLREGKVCIRFYATNADLEYGKWDESYPPICRDDRWRITGIPFVVNATIFYLGALAILYVIFKGYNQQRNNYLTQLNKCADAIPQDVKAVARYIAANQSKLLGKNMGLDLPEGLALPPFSGNADTIRLYDTTIAINAINKLQAVQNIHQPTFLWLGIKSVGLGFLILIGKQCLNWICVNFAKSGTLKSALQLLGFIKSDCSEVACYMQIVKPPQN